MQAEGEKLVRLDSAKLALMQHFVGWQCRLRQLAAREGDGRPTDGMRPELVLDGRRAGPDHRGTESAARARDGR